MKNLSILIITLLIHGVSFSQNAEAMERWLNSVEKEFQEIDQTSSKSNLRSGSPTYNRVRFNLLSDAYFIPVFGKPLDALSTFKRQSIGKKIQGLKQKKKFGSKYEKKYPWMQRLDWYLWGVFRQNQPYEVAVREVQDLRRIKKEYANTVQKLKSKEFDFINLKREKGQINTKYGKLIPKEIAYITSLINEQEKYTAKKAIATVIETLNNFEDDYTSMKKVERLKIENKTLYASADHDTQRNYNEQIETKISQILSISTTKEIENLTRMTANELNKFYTSFNEKYKAYASRKEIRRVNEQIYEAKKKKVISEFVTIASKIKASETLADLNVIENNYLSLVYQSDPKINSLSEKIVIRRDEIKKENELQKIAQKNLQETAVGEAMVLNTDGLHFAELFDYIFRGHFENIELKSDDILLSGIFDSYLRTYGKKCSEHLPDDKVDIMNLKCVAETVTTNGYGVETSRVCDEWTTRRSGYYARRDLYEAKMEVENFQRKNALQNGIKMFTSENAMGNSVDLSHKVKGLKKDMLNIFELNSCTSTSIRRFEENLKLFSQKKPGFRMQGESKYALMKKSGGPTGEQDLIQLTNDLVTDQAETWAVNQYKAHSINNLGVRKDKQGRPLALTANYSYSSLFGTSSGQVTIDFKNGLPTCIYFSDFPENCKKPKPTILVSYAQGDYRLE